MGFCEVPTERAHIRRDYTHGACGPAVQPDEWVRIGAQYAETFRVRSPLLVDRGEGFGEARFGRMSANSRSGSFKSGVALRASRGS